MRRHKASTNRCLSDTYFTGRYWWFVLTKFPYRYLYTSLDFQHRPSQTAKRSLRQLRHVHHSFSVNMQSLQIFGRFLATSYRLSGSGRTFSSKSCRMHPTRPRRGLLRQNSSTSPVWTFRQYSSYSRDSGAAVASAAEETAELTGEKLGDGITRSPDRPSKPEGPMDGHYAMVFTCKKCKSRSVRKISKQGYHKGTVLITCPGCNNRHVVADHLKVCFGFNLLPSRRGSAPP